MSGEALILAAILAPALAALAMSAPGRLGKRLKGLGVLGAGLALAASLAIGQAMTFGLRTTLVLGAPLPGVELAFRLEPLGALFAICASAAALMILVHGGGLARNESPQAAGAARLVAAALAAANAAAYAENLFTYFVFHEALTLCAAALIAAGGGGEARRAGERTMAYLLAASAAFLLPAIIWVHGALGSLSFRPGGLMAGRVEPGVAEAMLALFLLGLAKAAAAPLHGWIKASARAPAGAAAAVMALAAGAGAFGLVKISAMIFGPALMSQLRVAEAGLALALAGMIAAALVALTKEDLRERLVYSGASQWGLVAAAAMLATPAAFFGASLQIAAHVIAIATLTLGVGAVAAATGRSDADALNGLARRMPWTIAGVALAALSLGAAPPFIGAWPRLWLAGAGLEAGAAWVSAAAALGGVLSFAAFAPVAARAIFDPPPQNPFVRPDVATFHLAAPVAAGGIATVALLFWLDAISRFLGPGLSP
jgi:multicomponent Na+:H+ antiporter subunit D